MTTVDLDYDDPPVPPDLAARARARARRTRRRRRATAAGAAVVLVAGVAVGVTTLGPDGSTRTRVARPTEPATRLPFNLGDGPPQQHFATGSTAYSRTWMEPATGSPVVDLGDGAGTHVWLSVSGMICFGDRADGKLRPSSCSPLRDLPAEGLWGVTRFSAAEGPMNDSVKPIRSVVFGLVRGPVSRVDVHLPSGVRAAKLAPLPYRGLGTLFWTTTDHYTMADTVVGSGDTAVHRTHGDPAEVVVFRGGTATWGWSAADPPVGQRDR